MSIMDGVRLGAKVASLTLIGFIWRPGVLNAFV